MYSPDWVCPLSKPRRELVQRPLLHDGRHFCAGPAARGLCHPHGGARGRATQSTRISSLKTCDAVEFCRDRGLLGSFGRAHKPELCRSLTYCMQTGSSWIPFLGRSSSYFAGVLRAFREFLHRLCERRGAGGGARKLRLVVGAPLAMGTPGSSGFTFGVKHHKHD